MKILVEIDGVGKSVDDWSKESGIPASSIYYRINNGWSAKDAVFTAPHAGNIYSGESYELTKNGVEQELNDLSADILPKNITALFGKKPPKKPGTWFRTNHRKEFDKYYERRIQQQAGTG